MSKFKCPVCESALEDVGKCFSCVNRHSFDKASSGYVNLLMNNASSLKRHGDDKLMVKARRDFLEDGFYEPLKEALVKEVNSLKKSALICDIGCGEGYYTSAFLNEDREVFGVDISKDALKYASKRAKGASFAVASAYSLPFFDDTFDVLLNIFAPCAYNEFFRVLKSDGILIKAVPLFEHLWELKEAVYENPYKNKPEITDDIFEKIGEREIKYKIKLTSSQQIFQLFSMTPYFYKTSREDTDKLSRLSSLETTVHFGVEIYKKGCKLCTKTIGLL